MEANAQTHFPIQIKKILAELLAKPCLVRSNDVIQGVEIDVDQFPTLVMYAYDTTLLIVTGAELTEAERLLNILEARCQDQCREVRTAATRLSCTRGPRLGKVLIAKSLMLSQVIYLLHVQDMPEQVARLIDRTIATFIWGTDKREWPCREVAFELLPIFSDETALSRSPI